MTKETTTQQTIVNLLEIADQLANSAKSLQEKVKQTKQALLIPASAVAKKLPEVAPLGNTPLFRLKQIGDTDSFVASTLGVYCDDNGETQLFDCSLEPLEGFSFVRFKTGLSGYCVVKHGASNTLFNVEMSCSETHIEELLEPSNEPIEGEGKPLPSYLSLVPQPIQPVYSLPLNVNFEVIKVGNKSRKSESKTWESQLIDVQSEDGEVFKNVACNAKLARIVEKDGTKAKFYVASKRPKVNREGQPINASGKVDEVNPAMICAVVDLNETTFEDIEI